MTLLSTVTAPVLAGLGPVVAKTLGGLAPIATALVGQIQTDDKDGGGFWFPPQASSIAESIDWIFFFIYWICVFFFALIVVLMIVFVVKYRRREGVPAEVTPTHHTMLELTWTIIPLILVVAIFYLGLDAYANLQQAPANAYEVNVTAQRWNWKFDHPNGATDTLELKVPAGRPVKLIMFSEDVLHSLYIPSFRVKQDVVPGRFTTLWFEGKEPGRYQIFCAEFCGTQHSQMTASVVVLEEEDFQREIAADARWLDEFTDDQLYLAGLRLFSQCASCHSLDGSTKTGPSLQETHSRWGKSRVFTDGTEVTVDENYIRNSILDPQGQVVERFTGVMPTFKGKLKEREILALIQFIKRLNEVVDDQGNALAP